MLCSLKLLIEAFESYPFVTEQDVFEIIEPKPEPKGDEFTPFSIYPLKLNNRELYDFMKYNGAVLISESDVYRVICQSHDLIIQPPTKKYIGLFCKRVVGIIALYEIMGNRYELRYSTAVGKEMILKYL